MYEIRAPIPNRYVFFAEYISTIFSSDHFISHLKLNNDPTELKKYSIYRVRFSSIFECDRSVLFIKDYDENNNINVIWSNKFSSYILFTKRNDKGD